MKKTFDKLTAGDMVFKVYKNDIKYESQKITKVDTKHLYVQSVEIERYKETEKELLERRSYVYNDKPVIYFCNEVDAIRYCKAQSIKHLHRLIKGAKDAINEIKKFRENNYENLNINWTESELSKLERSFN